MDTSDGPPIYVGCRCPPLQQPTNPSRRTHRFYVTHNWNQLSVQWAKSDAHNILTTPTEEARGCKGENKRGLLPRSLCPTKHVNVMNIIDMNFYPHKTQTENRADEYAIFILREHISAKTKRIQKKKEKPEGQPLSAQR